MRSRPVRDGSLVRVYAGALASPKSRPSSTAGPSRRGCPQPATGAAALGRAGGRLEPWTSATGRALGLLGALAWLAAGPLLAAGPAAAAAGWRWPLDPPVAVVAEFAAPAGPFAPGHRGVDLGGQVGDPVRSAGAGVVAFAGVVAGRGVVSVDHPGGLRTSYEPVMATVARGDQVARGCRPGPARGWWPATARRRPACTGGCGGAGPISTRARCSVPSGSGCCRSGARPGRRSAGRLAAAGAGAGPVPGRSPEAGATTGVRDRRGG